MKHLLRLFLVALLCTAVLPTAESQIAPPYAARLQYVLDSMCNRHHIKGASCAVYLPGSGMWKGVYGESYAGQPITASMAFPLNSNTKTYVAALMLKLQESGALQLSDTIGTWIQNKANINGRITIRQLLSHTSGLYSYTNNAAFADSIDADFSRVWQPSEMLQFVGPPLFAPGTGWSYSNTNYLLAGMIIAQVTGMPVQQAIRTSLLNPYALSNTWFYPQEMPSATIPHFWFDNGNGSVVDGQAFGYTPEAFYSAASSAGALFSTAEDNALFWQKLTSGQIISAGSLSQWRQTTALTSNIGYGLGMFRYSNFNGHVAYEHGGTGAGAINENLVDSVTGVCISLLTNQDSADNDILLEQVIRALHKVTLDPPTAVVSLSPALYFKLYPNPANSVLQISCEGAAADLRYAITDAAGRTIAWGKIQGRTTEVGLADLQNGLYYVHLSDNEGATACQTIAVHH
jgi:D-alanyl-D-alanine carboxypeptidase